MIQINNLTPYQADMLDHIWSLHTDDEYCEWYDLLDEEDQKLADTLQDMVILATLDEMVEKTDLTDAKDILNKVAQRK